MVGSEDSDPSRTRVRFPSSPVAPAGNPIFVPHPAARATIDRMDIIWSLGLIVILLLALNHMAGGRASNVLRPVSNLVNGLFSFVVRLVLQAVGGIVRLFGGTLKLPGSGKPKIRDDKQPLGRTPPRWDE